jgi:beta-lactamase regulating signal transducer with metallopeptidase domain/HEAT repeat protein
MSPTALSWAGAHMLSNLTLVVFLVKATIILVAALGITRLMQRSSAGARHLVWLVALGALLLVPALTAWSPLRVAILPAASALDVGAPTNALLEPELAPRTAAPSPLALALAPSPSAAPLPAPTTSMEERLATSLGAMSAGAILLSIWALVALAILATLAWAALAVRRIVRRARPLDAPAWRTPLYEIADRFGLDEAPRLLCSDDAKMPFACGMLTPTIVLPAECEHWTLERRRAVLLHELAHVRRHDLLGHAVGRLACAAYWFHPLVWTAAKALRSESERACDDLALSCGTSAPDYAEHLLDIVTSVRRDATPLVALAMARRKEFEGRMLAILDPELRHAGPSRRQSLMLISTLALLAVTVGAAAPVPREQPRFDQDSRAFGSAPITIIQSRTDTATREITSERMRSRIATATSDAFAESVGVAVSGATSAAVNATVSAELRSMLGERTERSSERQSKQTADERANLLAKVLRSDTSETLRRVAAWGLAEYADSPVATEALATALRRDASATVREMAAWSLAQGDEGRAGTVDALTTALRGDASHEVRATAAWSLGNIGDRSAVDALVAVLNDPNPRLRTRALWAIGNIGPKQAPKAVFALLRDPDVRTRELAAWVLYQIEDPASIPALDAALHAEQNKEVQIADIRALATLGEQSVDALRGLLESPDPKIKSMAVHALAGGQAAGPWPWPWPEPRPFPGR